ncbi:ATP-dependent exoDNAse (exonuclease V) beta subunit [Sinobacterium caligoides]|uniref:DNA 3'-5' helicase n=1 Tax=Sinobacterium caligoides TaxID=933926 RepID=A0A3N2DJM4_9GAMM|nr:UvrD-helicase domain-containing protein [Sinobacterium caligoides]ROS00003.1 ATP-dependent exoDNAse (exonuclease V) beta subunit [Sinobacterium caligoides]
MSSLPVDYQQRAEALDIRQSFCVSAPAGSGKTELLTQRILRLLADCEKPEEVLAITFTRKAASEMRSRIVKALEEAWRNEGEVAGHQLQTRELALKVLERDANLQWQLLHNPARLRIQTIDGLCGALARQLPVMTQFGTSPKITDDHQPLYERAIHRLLSSQGDESGEVGEAIETLLWHLDNKLDKFFLLLTGLLAKRDQWLGLVGAKLSGGIDVASLNDFLEAWVAEQLEGALQLLAPYGSDIARFGDYAASQLIEQNTTSRLTLLQGMAALPGQDIAAVECWQAVAELLLTSGKWRKSMTKKQGFPAKDKTLDEVTNLRRVETKAAMLALLESLRERDDIRSALAAVSYLPTSSYNQQQWHVLQAISVILWQLNAHLQIVFSEQGEVDYTAISMAALEAMGTEEEPTELALLWDYTTRHILVDEFQDTANAQYALLVKLINGWYEDNENNPARPKTLFLVGDGMQSIYAFREANVGLFLQAREQGVGQIALKPLDLSVNFRSKAGVVEWNNRVFARSFPPSSDRGRGAVCYSLAEAFDQTDSDSAGRLLGCVDQEDRLLEAQQVVHLCAEARAKSTAGSLHSVAILVRNRSHLKQIIPALQEAGIPWQATDIHGLATQMVVQDVMTLTLAMYDLSDRISWLALLRSPLVGLSLNQFEQLSAIYLNTGCSVLSAYRQYADEHIDVRIRDTAEQLVTAWDNRLRKPLRIWLQALWIALGGAETMADSEQYGQVLRYFDLLEQLASNEVGLDTERLQQHVDKLYAEPLADSAAVQMMTIHKSKGLEFDTVILPGLDRQPRADDKPLFNWQQWTLNSGEQGILVAPLAAEGAAEDSIFNLLQQESKQKLLLEKTRLLYVAATRAVKQLYLVANLKSDEKNGGYKRPASSSLLSSVWDAVVDEVETVELPLSRSVNEQEGYAGIVRLPNDWQPEVVVAPSLLERYRRDPMRGKQQNIPSFDEYVVARHVGTVVHEYLQAICEQGVSLWCEKIIDQRRTAIRLRLKELGVAAVELLKAEQWACLLLNKTLASETGRWLLSSSHRDSQCEAELVTLKQGSQQRLIVDRSFIDEQGRRWIVDYKTASPSAGEEIELFIQQESEAYRQQLATYRNCYKHMENLPTVCALYFPSIDRLVKLTG